MENNERRKESDGAVCSVSWLVCIRQTFAVSTLDAVEKMVQKIWK